MLDCSAKGRRFEFHSGQEWQTLTVHIAVVSGYRWGRFKAAKGDDGAPPFIRITCPCVLYPLTPHFYIVKLGFTGVYIIFLFLF